MEKKLAALLASYIAVMPAAGATTPHATFGTAGDQSVEIYTLHNAQGIEARIMTYGATLVSLKTPDHNGKLQNIVLGFDTLQPYLDGVPYFGATVGRYANRIAQGKFSIDAKAYQLPLNNAPNSLHGGTRGFDKLVWKAEPTGDNSTLRLSLLSPSGDQGYPGDLTAHVTYRLLKRSLAIEFQATTTAATPINLANHSYFNLSGDSSKTILDHLLQINADKFTPVNATLIPTGELRPVAGTVFDFRTAHRIGERIGQEDEQLKFGGGYDHNWVLKRNSVRGLETVAMLSDPDSGRTMQIQTTQPGLQFYSGNFMDGKPPGQGSGFAYRTGLCLETQHFPDSPNQPAFPTSILRPGQVYSEKTVFVFGIAKAHKSTT